MAISRKRSVMPTKWRSGLVAALDLGTTKACCLIARADPELGLRVIGIGHQMSKGLRNGAIVGMDEAEASIRAAVGAAEQMAGETVQEVVVNLSGGDPDSRLIGFEVSIAGHPIGDSDLRRVLDANALVKGQPADRELVHAIPVGYSVDGTRGVRDPRGLHGGQLGVNLHVVGAQVSVVRNLTTCVARCHLGIEARVLSPYASALAALVDDEAELGVSVIDMGGGTTSIAVFFDGEMVHADVIPVGGRHVTNDIARGISTPLSHAERVKNLYGSALPTPSDDREVINVPMIGDERPGETTAVPRSRLVGIIRPRLEETFEMVRARLEATGFDKVAGRRVVLTGGASQLPGVRELAGMVLDKQVRLGRPRAVAGLAEAVSGPAFATAVGLLEYAVRNPEEALIGAHRPMEGPGGRFGRIGQWLRENF